MMDTQLKNALQDLVNFVPAHNTALDFDDQAAEGPMPLLSEPFLNVMLGDEDAQAIRERLAAVAQAAGTTLAELEAEALAEAARQWRLHQAQNLINEFSPDQAAA